MMRPSESGQMNPAELAQARLFDAILQVQFAKLNQFASSKAGSLDGGTHSSQDLVQAYAQLGEIQRLREALRLRFLMPGSDRQWVA